MPLATDRLSVEDDRWQIDPQIPLDESWHGACVLSPKEGKLVGIVLRTDEGKVIQGISKDLLSTK